MQVQNAAKRLNSLNVYSKTRWSGQT